MSESVKLSGALTLDSICRVQREVADKLTAPALVLDLSEVSEIDSTAVSLLLHWQRDAVAAGRQLTLQRPPANLTSLAALYGVEEFLPHIQA
ncbi:STAS domain-containing protein [Chitinimonas arctica]|uniref:STAS domain-containing protein n=1 Tax=Chitinimonas arctica TaxID=2594795 RepID=A0A516SEB9_9NEIS|nr:STAS domain-containing protein [Chitinimonas arctica]QDQ26502.1 STAS domain-containing protein [Chitinimonas arctica]